MNSKTAYHSKYFCETREVDEKTLFILKDWLCEVSSCLSFNLSCIQKVFELLERINYKVNIKRNYIQLTGITCMIICSKLFLSQFNDIDDYLYICDFAFTKIEFRDMMCIILHNIKLEFSEVNLFLCDKIYKTSMIKVGYNFNIDIALKIRALVCINTKKYSLEDISYVCENIISQEWSRGFPKKIYDLIMENFHNSNYSQKYNHISDQIKEKYNQNTSLPDNYSYNAAKKFDDEETLFHINRLEKEDLIVGSGTYGTVYKKNNTVLKICNYETGDITTCEFLKELKVYQTVNSKYVAKYIASSLNRIEIERYEKFCEFFTGEEAIVRFIKKICLGVKDIHDSGIIHADLSLNNILMDNQGDPKIIDFGLSVLRSCGDISNHNGQSVTIRAPEVHYGGICDYKIDIWSIGAIYYILKYQKLLTKNERSFNQERLKNKVSSVECPVFKSCLSLDPKGRPTIHKLIEKLNTNYTYLLDEEI